MKVILELPDEEVEIIKRNGFNKDGTFSFKLNEVVKQAIRNGVILPDNATNGDMIKAVFPNVQVVDAGIHRITAIFGDCHNMMYRNSYDEDWWNAPYKGGQGNGNDD